MHKEYFNDPFPINLTSDEVFDLYNYNKQIKYEEFKRICLSQNSEEINALYKNAVDYYMKFYFTQGSYMVVNNGYDLLQISYENDIINDTLKELNIDITHLLGMTEEDIQVMVIPFKEIDDMDYFGYIIRNNVFVEYWDDGEKIGGNKQYCIHK